MGKSKKNENDSRVEATKVICGSAVGMLAVCIPLCAVLKNPWLPVLVIAGSAVATLGVWFFGRSKLVATHSKELAALETTIGDLQERLENVEVINRYETALAEKSIETALAESELVEESPRSISMGAKGKPNGGDH